MRRILVGALTTLLGLQARAAYALPKPAPGAVPAASPQSSPPNTLIMIGVVVAIVIAVGAWRKRSGGSG